MQSAKINEHLFQVIKGVMVSLITMLACVLVFAFVIYTASLDSGVIFPVNCFIKVFAVFIGCFFSVRGKRGFIKGGLIGAISIILSYLLFALFASVSFDVYFLLDILFALIVGLLFGVITVNVKSK